MQFVYGALVGVFVTAGVFAFYFRKALTAYAQQEAAKAKGFGALEAARLNQVFADARKVVKLDGPGGTQPPPPAA